MANFEGIPNDPGPAGAGQVPGTEGPVDYPNRPEGAGGNQGSIGYPAGTDRAPEAGQVSPTAQTGAGTVGATGGLTPNPQEPTSGSVMKGYRGASYSGNGPASEAGEQAGQFVTGGPNPGSVLHDALKAPTEFTKSQSGPSGTP